jgi:hypothetical protein
MLRDWSFSGRKPGRTGCAGRGHSSIPGLTPDNRAAGKTERLQYVPTRSRAFEAAGKKLYLADISG